MSGDTTLRRTSGVDSGPYVQSIGSSGPCSTGLRVVLRVTYSGSPRRKFLSVGGALSSRPVGLPYRSTGGRPGSEDTLGGLLLSKSYYHLSREGRLPSSLVVGPGAGRTTTANSISSLLRDYDRRYPGFSGEPTYF